MCLENEHKICAEGEEIAATSLSGKIKGFQELYLPRIY